MKGQSQQALITMIDCVTAHGIYFDPGIIFKGVDLQYQWFEREMSEKIPGWHFQVSPNGWSGNDIAISWFDDVFLPQANNQRNHDESRAILLVLDGHDSHKSVCHLPPSFEGQSPCGCGEKLT